MTKIKLLGVTLLTALALLMPAQVVATEQVYAKSAPTATELVLNRLPVVDGEPARASNAPPCKNFLVEVLYEVGFRGENLREAWAIVMRESGGRADAVSSTGDYGIFQFNRAAWSGQEWWDSSRLLTREYNAKVAFEISRGGKTWYPWDIDGQGNWQGRYSSHGTYMKYKSFYEQYPRNCMN